MPRPIVLIHGAWHGGWCFDLVAEPLRERGFEVLAPDLPFTGSVDDIAVARACIEAHPGAVVLGHSYGGAIITHASVGLDVARLVFLCSFMPDWDEDPLPARSAQDRPALGGALESAIVTGDDGTLSVDPVNGIAAFYHDCPESEVRRAVDLLRPMRAPVLPVLEKEPPWATVASTYVVCTDDRALPADMQRALAVRARETVVWDVAHSPFLARPELLVDLLAGYAE